MNQLITFGVHWSSTHCPSCCRHGHHSSCRLCGSVALPGPAGCHQHFRPPAIAAQGWGWDGSPPLLSHVKGWTSQQLDDWSRLGDMNSWGKGPWPLAIIWPVTRGSNLPLVPIVSNRVTNVWTPGTTHTLWWVIMCCNVQFCFMRMINTIKTIADGQHCFVGVLNAYWHLLIIGTWQPRTINNGIRWFPFSYGQAPQETMVWPSKTIIVYWVLQEYTLDMPLYQGAGVFPSPAWLVGWLLFTVLCRTSP